jgi:hypothetical protein
MSRAREFADLAGSADAGGITGKNLIINGAMQVAQRGTSFTESAGYKLDRFRYSDNTDDSLTITQYTVTTGGETGLPIQFTNAMKLAITGGSTGTVNDLRQRIEFPERFMGQTLTLSYYAKASANTSSALTSNSRVSFNVASNAPSGASFSAVDLTTTWQRFEHTFTLGTNATMTTDASSYLDVVFASLIINTTVDIYITGVQLEVGEQGTPFEHRSYGDELARCQRYYYESGGTATNDWGQKGYQSANQYVANTLSHPVAMRASPTLTKAGTFVATNIAEPTALGSSTTNWQWQAQKDGTSGIWVLYSNSSGKFTLESEL